MTKRTGSGRTDEELFAHLRRLTGALPAESEIRRLLLNLDDPAHDESSKDRYVALVATGAVEDGLKVAIARRLGFEVGNPIFDGKLAQFDRRIKKAAELGILGSEETTELNRIRRIRNAFAHAVTAISFSTPEISELTKRLWHHPVTNWAGYFAPAFAPRHQFAIVCGEFYANFVRQEPVLPRGVSATATGKNDDHSDRT